MNLSEYKANKIKEVKRFLRRLHPENIGIKDKPILGHLTPECSNFFNKNEMFRKPTEKLLKKINEYYTDLVFTNLEYAGSKEEIDLEIKNFIDVIRREVNDYKYAIIKIAFQPKNDEGIVVEELQEVKEKNYINTGLNFIKLKVGENIYSVSRIGREAENEDVTLDNLNTMIVYIYVLKCMIDDKKQKLDEFVDFVATNYDVRDKEYIYIRKKQMEFLNEKNYEEFLKKYKDTVKNVVTMTISRDQDRKLEENMQKPKGK